MLHPNAARAGDARAALPEAEGVIVGDLSSIAGMRQVAGQANSAGRYDAVIQCRRWLRACTLTALAAWDMQAMAIGITESVQRTTSTPASGRSGRAIPRRVCTQSHREINAVEFPPQAFRGYHTAHPVGTRSQGRWSLEGPGSR